MSLHKSKGLTADLVVVAAAWKGLTYAPGEGLRRSVNASLRSSGVFSTSQSLDATNTRPFEYHPFGLATSRIEWAPSWRGGGALTRARLPRGSSTNLALRVPPREAQRSWRHSPAYVV